MNKQRSLFDKPGSVPKRTRAEIREENKEGYALLAAQIMKTAPRPKRANGGPNWGAADPFAHLPRLPMRIEQVVPNADGYIICGSCGRETKVCTFYVRVEGAETDMCQYCLKQQTQASATRDTLVRVVGLRIPATSKKPARK